MNFAPNTNGNARRCDRTLPGFTMEFLGSDNAKYESSSTNGEFHFCNGSGGGIRFTPRLLDPDGTKVIITGITLNVSKAKGGTTIHLPDGSTGTISSTGSLRFNFTGTADGDAYFTADASNDNNFFVTSVILHYVAADGTDPALLLDNTKVAPLLTLAKETISIFTGDATSGDVSVQVATPFLNKDTKAYSGVNGTYYAWYKGDSSDNLSIITTPSGIATVSITNLGADINSAHQPAIHYETTSNGQTYAYFSIASNEYFDGASIMLTISNPVPLASGGSANTERVNQGEVVEIWAVSKDGTAVNLTLTNAVSTSLTGTATTEAQIFKTYASATEIVTITNSGSGEIGIIGANHYYKTATVNYSYPQDFTYSGFKVGPPTCTVTDNEGNDVTSQFEQGTVSLNPQDTYLTHQADGILLGQTVSNPDNQTTASVQIKLKSGEFGFDPAVKYSVSDKLRVIPFPYTWHFDEGYSDATGWTYTNNRTDYYNNNGAAPVTYGSGTELSTTLGLLFEGGFRIYKSNGMYYAAYQGSAIHIPVKRGQLLTFNAAMASGVRDIVITNGMDDDGNDVSAISVSEANQGYSNYTVIAKADGYLTLTNNTNREFNVKWIEVGKNPLKFKDGNSVVASTGTSEVNNYVCNIWDDLKVAGGTITYSITSEVNEDGNSENIHNTFDTTTGKFTGGFIKNGTIEVTAKYNNPDLVHETEGTYTLHITDYRFDHSPHEVLLNNNGHFSFEYQPYDNEGHKLSKPNPLNNEAEIPTFSYEILASAEIDGSMVESHNLKADLSQEENVMDFSISGTGTGVIRVTAKAHYLVAQFDLVVKGATFINPCPSIPSTAHELLNNKALNMTDVTYELYDKSKGITSVTVAQNTGDITNIEGCGVFTVKATGTYNGSEKTIYSYVTVADEAKANHDLVWNFYRDQLHLYSSTADNNQGSELNLPHNVDDYLNTPVEKRPNYDLISNGTFAATYRSRTYNDDSDPVCAYVAEMNGQNAYLMMETIGLQIFSASKALGVQTSDAESGRFIGLKTGTRLVIPKVKPGQYVQILWQRHSPGNGEYLNLKNLNDLNGKRINTTLGIARCNYMIDDLSSEDPKPYDWQGTYTFQVANDEDDPTAKYVDVVFEVVVKGWTDFFQIRVYDGDYRETMNPKLRQLEDRVSVDKMPQLAATRELHERDVPLVRRYHSANFTYGPASPCQFRIELINGTLDETTTVSKETWYSATNTPWPYPQLNIGNGWGKLKLIYEPLSQDEKYVINRKEYIITIGQIPHQQYPYTWDFTNVSGGALANDYENAYQLMRDDTRNWTGSSTTYTMQTDENSNYVPGAIFVNSDRPIKEFDGLGVTTNGLTQNMQSVASARNNNGQTRAESTEYHMTFNTETTLTIPDLNENGQDWIYISSSVAPTAVSNATRVTAAPDGNDANTNVYKYKAIDMGASEITFAAGTDIYQIGVTHILKEITKVGDTEAWATESREHAIDHALTGYFTCNNVDANTVTVSKFSDDKSKTIVQINPINEDGFVPEETGLVLRLKKEDSEEQESFDGNLEKMNGWDATAQKGNIPLFYPAITTPQTSTITVFPSYNLMHDRLVDDAFWAGETETIDGISYTRFILAKRYMTWIIKDGTLINPTAFESKEAAVFYRLHLYTQEEAKELFPGESENYYIKLNTLGANKAYLLLRTDKINDPIWPSASPAREYIGISGVSDMDDETGETVRTDYEGGRTYNMGGQAVDTDWALPPGIYIRNGKKMIVK